MRPVTKISIFGIRLGIVLLGIYWLSIFVGTHLPAVVDFSPNVNDKLKHISAFFGLATLLCYVTNSQQLVKRFAGIIAICLIYAAIDETTQMFIPGRTADPYDFLADGLGVCLAVTCYVSLKVVVESNCCNRIAQES